MEERYPHLAAGIRAGAGLYVEPLFGGDRPAVRAIALHPPGRATRQTASGFGGTLTEALLAAEADCQAGGPLARRFNQAGCPTCVFNELSLPPGGPPSNCALDALLALDAGKFAVTHDGSDFRLDLSVFFPGRGGELRAGELGWCSGETFEVIVRFCSLRHSGSLTATGDALADVFRTAEALIRDTSPPAEGKHAEPAVAPDCGGIT